MKPMSAEITKLKPDGHPAEGVKILQQGGVTLINTPAGEINIGAEESSFVVTRPNTDKPGTRYFKGQSLTINYPTGERTIIVATDQRDLEAQAMLEPML